MEANNALHIRDALSARFIPSAYYPAMRWEPDREHGRDYLAMSRSMAILDFRGLRLQPAYAEYLQEYFRLWRELYIGKVFPTLE